MRVCDLPVSDLHPGGDPAMNAPYHPKTQTRYGDLPDHDLCSFLRTHDDPLVLMLVDRLEGTDWQGQIEDLHKEIDEKVGEIEQMIDPGEHDAEIKTLENQIDKLETANTDRDAVNGNLHKYIAELEQEIKEFNTLKPKGNSEMSLEAQMKALTDVMSELVDGIDKLNSNVTDAAIKTKPAPVDKPKPTPAKNAKAEPAEAPADNDNSDDNEDLKGRALAALTKVAEEINRAASLKIMLQYTDGAKQFSKVDPDFYGNIIEDCEAKLDEAA
jgi:DNA repair exonuclease SbcCD ATPase subunit